MAADNLWFVEAVHYRYRAGGLLPDPPDRFGDWKITHQRHGRWSVFSSAFFRCWRAIT
jgi:hypothetical protein